MSSHVEQIKERLPIQEVIASYIKIEKAGGSIKARCPFHNEKTPSFFISPDRGTYYCFGCGAKGDIFSFVEQFENVDFKGALKILADRAGVVLTPENPTVLSEKDRLYRIMEYATKFYQKHLSENPPALDYVRGRGLTDATIQEWRLGLAVDQWSSLYDSLRQKASDAEIEKAGLIKKREGAQGYYDRFRSRIMFPFLDPSERPVAFSGRHFGEEKPDAAKYLNSPETPLFHKSSLLYGYHKAKTAMRLKNYALLVEGQMDLLMCHQSGYANTVATSGTSLTGDHLDIIKRLTDNVVIAFDGDGAGMRASTRAWELALTKGMNVSILALPKGLDPADALVKDPALFEKALHEKQHIIDFHLAHIVESVKNLSNAGSTETLQIKARLLKTTVIPYIAALESVIEQSHFVKKVSDVLGIDEQAVWSDVRVKIKQLQAELRAGGYQQSSYHNGEGQNGEYTESMTSIEKSLNQTVASRLAQKDIVSLPVRTILGIIYWKEAIGSPPDNQYAATLRTRLRQLLEDNTEQVEAALASIKEELIFQAESYYAASKHLDADIEELFTTISLDVLKQELEIHIKALAAAEKKQDNEQVAVLKKRSHELSKQIAELTKKR